MLTLSNGLSFIRGPIAFLFLQESISLRLIAIFLAMITDSVDGYLARKNQATTQFGAVLDPTMDKFFVYFALGVLYTEGTLSFWQVGAMLARDFFLCLYGLLMLVARKWKQVVFRAIRWGKVTTALQFIVLIGLVVGVSFSWWVYALFIAMGGLAFLELLQMTNKSEASSAG